jgi:glycerol-3-phosphate dehydrogenase (NAD(P)+)
VRALVVGAGAWGSTIAVHLARKGLEVALWARDPARAAEMAAARENRRYLPGVPFPAPLQVVRAPEAADLVVNAVPTQHVRDVFAALRPALAPAPLLSLSKGIEVATGMLPTRVLAEVLGSERPVAVLTGPCIAQEVARGLPTAVVVAGDRAAWFQEIFTTDRFRVYTSDDAAGAELAAALKNVMGIAAGIVDGLALGDNAKASLLTRGIAEIMRLGVALGAQAKTFAGLAGFGDLFTTCVSPLGRNRGVGERIGRGEPVASILAGMHAVAEGVPTTRAVLALAQRRGVEMPITEALSGILFDGVDPRAAIARLMTRATRAEHG